MRLAELEASFVRYETRREQVQFRTESGGVESREVDREYIQHVRSLAEAQGVQFLCPLCFAANGGPVGTHWCSVSFEGRGVADGQGSHNRKGEPTRWAASGTGLDDLSLSPSVQIEGGCGWHGHVAGGAAE